MYRLIVSPNAKKDLEKLKRDEPKAAKKALELLKEIIQTPYSGIGKPHPLVGDKTGQWSRRITQKHRLVYEIIDNEVVVLVISAYGHYDDK